MWIFFVLGLLAGIVLTGIVGFFIVTLMFKQALLDAVEMQHSLLGLLMQAEAREKVPTE